MLVIGVVKSVVQSADVALDLNVIDAPVKRTVVKREVSYLSTRQGTEKFSPPPTLTPEREGIAITTKHNRWKTSATDPKGPSAKAHLNTKKG
jgi:hypothetical protein